MICQNDPSDKTKCLNDISPKMTKTSQKQSFGPDEGLGVIWNIHASVVQDRGLEMSFWHLALNRDHFDIS